MAAYRRVYDSRHLQADCQEPGSAPEPYTIGIRVWATFILPFLHLKSVTMLRNSAKMEISIRDSRPLLLRVNAGDRPTNTISGKGRRGTPETS